VTVLVEVQERSGAVVEVHDGTSSIVAVEETSGAIVEVHDATTNTVLEIQGAPASTIVEVRETPGAVVEIHGVPAGTTVEVFEAGTSVATVTRFVYVMPVAQTTATIDHDLGRDPIVVQVLDESGEVCDEFSVVYTIPNQQLRVGFDIPVKATIRVM